MHAQTANTNCGTVSPFNIARVKTKNNNNKMHLKLGHTGIVDHRPTPTLTHAHVQSTCILSTEKYTALTKHQHASPDQVLNISIILTKLTNIDTLIILSTLTPDPTHAHFCQQKRWESGGLLMVNGWMSLLMVNGWMSSVSNLIIHVFRLLRS